MGFMDVVAWIGRFRALVGLICGVIVCIIFWMAGLYVMFSKKEFGKGIVLILLGAVFVIIPAIWYYFVMRSNTVAKISGVIGIADVFIGGKQGANR